MNEYESRFIQIIEDSRGTDFPKLPLSSGIKLTKKKISDIVPLEILIQECLIWHNYNLIPYRKKAVME
jgi:hypothetical protein